MTVDVAVVGAGFCGLSAALALQGAGVSLVVLEARDRVGGRVESVVNGLGERIDTGGQYFCDGMDAIMDLARIHGTPWVHALRSGRGLVEPKDRGVGIDDLYLRMSAIRDRANDYAPDDPAIAGLSVRDWTLLQPDDADAKAAFLSAIEGLWCQPTDRLPLWYLVSNDRRITNEGPELQYFLSGTMHGLAEALAARLGGVLRTGEPVLRIERGADGPIVVTGCGAYTARHAIVAVPPMTAGRIPFDPPLPDRLARALSVWESGKVIKATLRYPTPFWREAGLSGSVFYLDTPGFYATDASLDDDHAAIVVFIGGLLAQAWSSAGEAATRAAILEKLTIAFGPRAGAPIEFTYRDWSGDRWSGGAYSDTIFDMHATDAEDLLRAGAPGLTFAASELSPSFPGYIEGAVVAGRAAAERALSALEDLRESDAAERGPAQSAIATSASGS